MKATIKLPDWLEPLHDNVPTSTTGIRTVSSVFNGKYERAELFVKLIQTMLRKMDHFHSHLTKDALQITKLIESINTQTLDNLLVVCTHK